MLVYTFVISSRVQRASSCLAQGLFHFPLSSSLPVSSELWSQQASASQPSCWAVFLFCSCTQRYSLLFYFIYLFVFKLIYLQCGYVCPLLSGRIVSLCRSITSQSHSVLRLRGKPPAQCNDSSVLGAVSSTARHAPNCFIRFVGEDAACASQRMPHSAATQQNHVCL